MLKQPIQTEKNNLVQYSEEIDNDDEDWVVVENSNENSNESSNESSKESSKESSNKSINKSSETQKATETQQIIDIPNTGVKNCHKIRMDPDQIVRYLKYLDKQFRKHQTKLQESKEESKKMNTLIDHLQEIQEESSDKSYSIRSLGEDDNHNNDT